MITNATKPSTALVNASRASSGVTWGEITTTWATEPDLWEDYSSIINNEAVQGQGIWSSKYRPWRADAPWQTVANGISNLAKPI